MNKFVVISYYTKETPYEREVEKFRKSAEKFGLETQIVGYNNRGSWAENTRIKANFILDELKVREWNGDVRPVVFVDIDARFLAYPSEFDNYANNDIDLGIAYRDFSQTPSIRRREGRELLSGTIYLANNIRVKALLMLWATLNKKDKSIWEQKNLEKAIKSLPPNFLTINVMPPTYCKIYDLMRSVGPAVIEHYQASRKYRQTFRANVRPIPIDPKTGKRRFLST